MIEVILEIIFPAIGRFFGYLLLDLFSHGMCYISGYVLIKIATIGKYPEQLTPAYSNGDGAGGVILVGILFWVLIVVCVVLF
jgi:hypothetical protein